MNKKIVTCDEVKPKILDNIRRNRIRAGQRLPSFRALAREFGSSIPTVQRAVSMLVSEGLLTSKVGSGTYVSESSPPSSKFVGVLMPHIPPNAGNFMTDAFVSMRKILLDHGYFPVSVEPTPNTSGQVRDREELELIRKLVSQGMAGIIVDSCADEASPIWRELQLLNIPVLCFNNSGRGAGNLDCVSANNYQGGVLAAERLLVTGRRAPVIVSDPFDGSSSVRDRIRGFIETMREAGVAVAPDAIIPCGVLLEGKEPDDAAAGRFRAADAVFGINDGMAIIAMKVLQRTGRRIPADVAVIGFDDSELCEHVTPRLDSVRQASAHMGRRAAELLLERIENPANRADTIQLKTMVSLVIRDSVK